MRLVGYIAKYAASIVYNEGSWDSFILTREKWDTSDVPVYVEDPRPNEDGNLLNNG